MYSQDSKVRVLLDSQAALLSVLTLKVDPEQT
jgi:hypothetical protein